MFRVLAVLWPALLPLLLFLIWYAVQKRRAKKNDETAPRLKDGPWFMITISTIVIAIACILILGFNQQSVKGNYSPTRVENGKVLEGSIQP